MTFSISIHLFDTKTPCGRNSVLNFVHYIWDNYSVRDNYSVLPCEKYALAILETEFLKQAKMYYLKHYRAESDRWTSQLFCNSCISICKRSLQEYTFGCTLSDTCKWKLCICQPPTLKSLAAHSICNVLYHFDKYVLSDTTTYEQYKFAAKLQQIQKRYLTSDWSRTLFR